MKYGKKILAALLALLITLGMCGCSTELGDTGLTVGDIFKLVGSLGKQAIDGLKSKDLSDLKDLLNDEYEGEYSEDLDNMQWRMYAEKDADGVHRVFDEEDDNTLVLLHDKLVYINFYPGQDSAEIHYQYMASDKFNVNSEWYMYNYHEISDRSSQPTFTKQDKYEAYEGCGHELWYISMSFSGPGSFGQGGDPRYDEFYDTEEFRYRTEDPAWPLHLGEDEIWRASVIDGHLEVARYAVTWTDGKKSVAETPFSIWYLHNREEEVPALPQ